MKSAQRALIECRRRGWPAGIVERSIPSGGNQFIRTRVDLFGLFDIVAMDDGPGVNGIQACLSDVTAHVKKIDADPKLVANLARWLGRGNRATIFGFRRVKVKRGGVAVRWAVRELRASLDDGRIKWSEA